MPRRFPIPSYPAPLDQKRVKVFPLKDRKSLTSVEDILVSPDTAPPEIPAFARDQLKTCARQIVEARERGASVMLIYGAHLLRNGAALILEQMMANGWLTHLATNGAGTIHDWEYAFFGRSTESVEQNVRTGTFGTWDETGKNIHLALYAGALKGEGYGRALGRLICEDQLEFPAKAELEGLLRAEPSHPLASARAEMLAGMNAGFVPEGHYKLDHRWKHASILAQAFKHNIPLTVHPGIGYDIIANHPMFNGAVIGRAAAMDFAMFGAAVEKLDGGVVLSVGSAIMGPQVFEKSLSCVNNLRIQDKRPIVKGHSIYVVDLQDGGNWDWTQGEPPKTNPAYYLRFCKSFSRMGGAMRYLQCDNLGFIANLHAELLEKKPL
jgi:hypothetical protein